MEFALWRDARLWAVPRGAPQFFIADQDVCAAGIQINAHHVPRLQQGQVHHPRLPLVRRSG